MALLDSLRNRLHRHVYTYSPGYGVQVANLDTALLYRTQPNLRAVVSYLADNAAQVPLKVHDRVSDDDRPRVLDSPAALLLAHPNEDMTAYELKRAIYSDMLLYGRCLCLVLPDAQSESGWQLRHIPATWVAGFKGDWVFAPDYVVISHAGASVEVPRSRFILFHGYDPTDPMRASEPVEALKDILHEQVESNRFRRQMWQRGGRFNAYIARPKDVEKWDDESFNRFRETWRNSWAGDDAAHGGGTPILEDGMEIKQVQFNSRDAQWADAKKLGREDVAGVYHINPALIWPGTGQTYASAKDNARALYNEALAPQLMQVANRLDQFLLPMIGEEPSHYVAYDVTVKTEGTFEEKISALQTATGAPILTRNEARAKLDLPAVDGGDELITPLNVSAQGSAPNTDNSAELSGAHETKERERRYKAAPSQEETDEYAGAYRDFFKHQRSVLLPKLGAEKKRGNVKASAWWNADRWNAELSNALYPVAMKHSALHAEETIDELGIDLDYSTRRTENYIRSMCDRRARAVNEVTKRQLDDVDDWDVEDEDEPPMGATYAGVFDMAEDDRSVSAGAAIACAVAGFAALEVLNQSENSGALKTWVVTSSNPRPEHAAMNGETVPYNDEFSNGAMWPGDSALDAADVANCQCQIEITIP